jgi:uncharacterized protein
LDRILATGALLFFGLRILGALVGGATTPTIPGPSAPDPPSPLAEPAPPGTAASHLQESLLYEAGGLPEVDCPAPSQLPDTQAQENYHRQMFECLTEAWHPVLSVAGIPPGEPRLFVFSEPGNSPCGSFDPLRERIFAFYCVLNQTTYIDAAQLARAFPPEHHIAYGMVLAHEYGHYTQDLAGILAMRGQLSYQEPDAAPEISRRTETQASCLGGMFFNAVEGSYPVEGTQLELLELYAYNSVGDRPDAPPEERTHGTPFNQGMWIMRGFGGNNTAVCNTFVAPSSEVQ